MFCMGAAVFGAMIVLPLYFQVARGQDAITTGLLLIPQGIGGTIGMNRSAAATLRFGAGLTSLFGVLIMVCGTAPFLFVGATTPYGWIGAAMVLRGVGIGLAFMPAMTAAFSPLNHDQVNEASPQLNVIQRVGGSLGTAIIAVVLQTELSHLPGAGTKQGASATAVAASFAHTYRWVILMSILAIIPATVLWRVERQLRASGQEAALSDDALVEAIL
jgi:hypothetical protein